MIALKLLGSASVVRSGMDSLPAFPRVWDLNWFDVLSLGIAVVGLLIVAGTFARVAKARNAARAAYATAYRNQSRTMLVYLHERLKEVRGRLSAIRIDSVAHRLDSLPPLLDWIDTAADARQHVQSLKPSAERTWVATLLQRGGQATTVLEQLREQRVGDDAYGIVLSCFADSIEAARRWHVIQGQDEHRRPTRKDRESWKNVIGTVDDSIVGLRTFLTGQRPEPEVA
jgi:hypothetical protein